MNLSHDVIVVGGGLAGACAALHLSRSRRVLLLEASRQPSGVAAGLVNPLMSQRAKPVWRMEEALDALHATLGLAGAADLFRPGGVLRPAPDEAQAAFFRQAAERHPGHAEWLPPAPLVVRYPDVRAPHGGLLVRSGGALPFNRLLDRITSVAMKQGAEVRTGAEVVAFGESEGTAWVDVAADGSTERLYAEHVVLALGGGWSRHSELKTLRLHDVKGQTVEVRPTEAADLSRVPHLAGAGYVASGAETLVVGSSYEHVFADLDPSPEQTAEILRKAKRMLPLLESAVVVSEFAGVRVTVPGVRLPMVGPLPGRRRLWIFTGLGSKGLLMAPLLARELDGYLNAPERIPAEVRVRQTVLQ